MNKHIIVSLFVVLCSFGTVRSQERINEFVVNTDETHNPMTIYSSYGATPNDGVVIVNSTIPNLEFNIPAAPGRIRTIPDKKKNRYVLIISPNDVNYQQYTITINAKGFVQGKINDVVVKAGLSSGFIVNSKFETNKKYRIGDDAKDLIGRGGYRIAYLDASGKHGFAIQLEGKTISECRASPTLQELKLMYQYRHLLGLEGEYWSSDETHELTSDVYTFDFSSGKTHKRHSGGGFYLKRNGMLIERF